MIRKLCIFLLCMLVLIPVCQAVDASTLLPPEKAFMPKVMVNDQKIEVHFTIADDYYLYQRKITATTQPEHLLAAAQFLQSGEQKEDDFFGKQQVFHHQVDVHWPYQHKVQTEPYVLILSYQGCASAGICYPPVKQIFKINGNGIYTPAGLGSALMQKLAPEAKPKAVELVAPNTDTAISTHLHLSRQTLWMNLIAFFVAGLGLSLTACSYPLIPIVSAIVIGQKHQPSKIRALGLSFIYVQGLALTYTVVGVITARTGALLSGWLQQRSVILTASGLLVLLALSMFDLYHVQLPARWQGFFQQMSARFRGGHWLSVFIMGALSALIVGPCVAPPLAFALGYIGQSGDVLLGGLALYALALGTGIPLMLIAVFGSHILPRSGQWMLVVKYVFGCLLLAAAIYLATPFLPYMVVISAYALLLLILAVILLWNIRHAQGAMIWFRLVAGLFLLISSGYFVFGSLTSIQTPLHRLLTLTPPDQVHFGRRFTDPEKLNQTMQQLLAQQPNEPVLVDFYADWCVSCKEMAAYTFKQPKVQKIIASERFLQLDVTQNTPAQQKMLHQYNLYGPPGLFMVYTDKKHSAPLLGFVHADQLLEWYYRQRQ